MGEPRAHCPEFGDGPIDLILVPGVAFDRAGGRLGRGAGFYDAYLRDVRVRGDRTMGIALPEQVVERVPREAHDVSVGSLATASGVSACGVSDSGAPGP